MNRLKNISISFVFITTIKKKLLTKNVDFDRKFNWKAPMCYGSKNNDGKITAAATSTTATTAAPVEHPQMTNLSEQQQILTFRKEYNTENRRKGVTELT